MGYIDKYLTTDETIIYQIKLNCTEYIKRLVFIILGILFGSYGAILIIFGILTLGISYFKIRSSEFIVTFYAKKSTLVQWIVLIICDEFKLM